MVWLHLTMALLALVLGGANLALAKGTYRHRVMGWSWMAIMTTVAISSFAIRDLNAGQFSWIHGLSVFTLVSMATAIVAIRRGNTRRHAGFMIGTMTGAAIAAVFALMPGRFISELLGY